jgi:hypothetical protein
MVFLQDGGGGGGGDGWNWERTAKNVAPNLFVLGMYFFVTSYGGDGFKGEWFGEFTKQYKNSCVFLQ